MASPGVWTLSPVGIWKGADLLQPSWALGYATAVTQSALGPRGPLSPSRVVLVSSGRASTLLQLVNLSQGRAFISPSDYASAPAFLAHWAGHPKPASPRQGTDLPVSQREMGGRRRFWFLSYDRILAHCFLDVSLLVSLRRRQEFTHCW